MHKACLSRRPFIPDIIMVCQKTGAKDRGLCRLTYRLLIKVLVFVSQEQKFIQEPIEIIQEPIEINHASSICFLPEKKNQLKSVRIEIRLGFLTSQSCAKLWFHLPEFTQLLCSLIPMELIFLNEESKTSTFANVHLETSFFTLSCFTTVSGETSLQDQMPTFQHSVK